MEGLGAAASVIAVVQLSAKVGSLCTDYFKAAKNARSDIKRLQGELETLNVVLRAAEGLVKGSDGNKLHTTGQLKPALDEAKSQLEQLIDDLKDKQPKARKGTRRGFRDLKWPFKRSEVDTIVQNLERNRDNISMALDIDNTALHIETCSTVQGIRSNVQHISRTLDMSKIPVAKGAAFDSYTNEHDPKCLPNTRVELLETIAKWAGEADSDPIFWLNGMAGTGKSTISRTIAHSFAEEKTLGASFFFKRGERDRGNASRLFTTVAAQLITRLPEIGPLVIKAIEDDPDLPNKFNKEQFEKLILGPLEASPFNSRTLILVIDALDECDRDADVRLIIDILTRLKSLGAITVKTFLTSRPELSIRLGFNSIKGKYKDVILHEIPKQVIKNDISEFFGYQLEQARLEYNCQSDPSDQLGPEWPGTQATNTLIEMAIPLFIFAATMCRFIRDPLRDPASQLEKVLSYKSSAQDSEMKKLDTTYRPTLDQLLVGRTGREKEMVLKDFGDVVGTIVLLEEPLSISTLSCLVDMPKRVISGILRPLHSVLSIPTSPQEPVRMLHLSFHDFLVDKDMHETNPFWVDEQETHKKLATRCLDLLCSGKHLKQDICDLGWPGARRGEIEQENIGLKLPDQVQYACLYWIRHLNKSGLRITDSHSAFSFLKDYFLFWLEALAILGEAHNCSSMINALQSIVDQEHGARLLAFLGDATRFVTRVDTIIDEHPLQIYASGLVFAPEESIVRAAFWKCVPEWITQFPQVPQNWNASLRVIETSLGMRGTMSFLPDSRSLQVVSRPGVVQVWDSMTGKQLDNINPDGRYDIIFSLDGGCSLSTNIYRTVLFWGSLRGSVQHRFEETIALFDLSGDGKLAACALQDGTVFVLDYLTGSMRRRLYGEKRKPELISLSPDGELLAITQSNGLQLWDVNTGRKTKEIPGIPGGRPCFSPNSRLIASFRYSVVVVYDIRMGGVFRTFHSSTKVFSAIAFSPDSQHVASASSGGTACIWHLATAEEVHRFEHDCNSITDLVFSPDGCLLAASSPDDDTILLWDPNSTVENVENDSKGPVSHLALSRDGKRVASGFFDGGIGIWDLDTACQVDVIGKGKLAKDPHWLSFSQAQEGLIWSVSLRGSVKCYDTLTGGTEVVVINRDHIYDIVDRDGKCTFDSASVALSPDGNTIALAFSQSVQIWNLVTREMRHTLNAGAEDIRCIGFSSDSKKLALSTMKNNVTIWDLASGCVQQKLSIGHHYQDSDAVTGLSLHDSKLAISSDSGRLAFWDIKTGAHLGSVQADGCFGYLEFSADGSRLVTERGDIRTPPLHCNGFDEPRSLHDLEGYGLTKGHAWISWKSRPFMWLPRSHRPSKSYIEPGSSLIMGSTVILGSNSGLVSILKFVETPPWASRARPGP